MLVIRNIWVLQGGMKCKAQRKVSLDVEEHRIGQRSNLSVWKRVNECACEWLPRPYPKSLMEKQ